MENSNSQAGININTPIRFQDELPDKVDLVVVGGGVIGIFSALYAQRAGLKTLVIEKGRVAGEQSSRNWGWLSQQGRDADELPIVMEANRLWGEVDKQVNGKTGFVSGGCFYPAREEERLNTFSEWMEIARQHQLETHLLSAKDLAKHIDHTAGTVSSRDSPWIGGVWTPSDARADACSLPERWHRPQRSTDHHQSALILQRASTRVRSSSPNPCNSLPRLFRAKKSDTSALLSSDILALWVQHTKVA